MPGFILSDFIEIIATIFVPIFLYYLSRCDSQDDYKVKMNTELKNVAKAIYLEITQIEASKNFTTAYILYTRFSNDPPYVPPIQFYNTETGLYFVYQHDIAKLESGLSHKIYTFYDDLINAENLRSFISQNRDFFEKDIDRTVKYYKMKKLIRKCGDLIPELKEKLENIQNL